MKVPLYSLHAISNKVTSGSLPTYKLKLQGVVALVHVETIGRGQIFIEDCKRFFFYFVKTERERSYTYIFMIYAPF